VPSFEKRTPAMDLYVGFEGSTLIPKNAEVAYTKGKPKIEVVVAGILILVTWLGTGK
jgi:hypothetical protein